MVGAGRVAWLLMRAWHSARSSPVFREAITIRVHSMVCCRRRPTVYSSREAPVAGIGGGARVLAYLSGTTVEFQNDCNAQHCSLAVREKLVGGRTSMGLTAFETNCRIPLHHYLSEPPTY